MVDEAAIMSLWGYRVGQTHFFSVEELTIYTDI